MRLLRPTSPPAAFSSALVNGETLTITFDGMLDTNSVLVKEAFEVTVGGDEVDLADTNPVSISRSALVLEIAGKPVTLIGPEEDRRRGGYIWAWVLPTMGWFSPPITASEANA